MKLLNNLNFQRFFHWNNIMSENNLTAVFAEENRRMFDVLNEFRNLWQIFIPYTLKMNDLYFVCDTNIIDSHFQFKGIESCRDYRYTCILSNNKFDHNDLCNLSLFRKNKKKTTHESISLWTSKMNHLNEYIRTFLQASKAPRANSLKCGGNWVSTCFFTLISDTSFFFVN